MWCRAIPFRCILATPLLKLGLSSIGSVSNRLIMKKIFIACAHTPGDPLNQLISEARKVEQALRPLQERGLLDVISNRAANVDDIFQTFSAEQDVEIFHYAGHADGETLYLEEAGNIKGLSDLFGINKADGGSESRLRLAFINGCSSKGQVTNLHQSGIAAVIATSRPIEDTAARTLAEQFYKTWTLEDKTLEEAFETAKARVHTIEGESTRGILMSVDFSEPEAKFEEAIPWGLYINPALENKEEITTWKLNEAPKLPAMMLASIKPNPTQSLRELVHEFRKTDKEAQQLIRNERKDPLMVLIERLPWIIGTHLRRLFAVEESRTMADPGLARLKELIAAYTELTRFLNYITLSMLWDAKGEGFDMELFPFTILPIEEEQGSTDFVFRIRTYYQQLIAIDNQDPLQLEPAIGLFLKKLDEDENLKAGYLIMEAWKQALIGDSSEGFDALVGTRSAEKAGGLKDLVLEAEAIFARFLKAALFLTQYKLHTVRSIVVDKVRNLAAETPYSHYTISLHAAFSQLTTSMTERATATDNYCLLLTARQAGGDNLDDAINLSPFYLDRSSFIGNSTTNYPAVFVLDHYQDDGYDKKYVFHYIDKDINHKYAFDKDNELVIDPYGAVLPDHLEASPADLERFERIYEQLQQLERDIPQAD